MFWINATVVFAVLFALAWWSSGKTRPLGRRTARAFSPAERQKQVESEAKRRGGHTGVGGYGGPDGRRRLTGRRPGRALLPPM